MELASFTPKSIKLLEEHNLHTKLEKFIDNIGNALPQTKVIKINIGQVEDLEDHFGGIESEYFSDSLKTRLMVSATDLFLIIELVYQNLSSNVRYHLFKINTEL